MTTRPAKLARFATIGLFYTLVVFNNLTDFDSNYQFVRHVLMMDTPFSVKRGIWRGMIHGIVLLFLLQPERDDQP